MPPVFELHDSVAVPEPVTLLGLMVPQLSPDGTVSVRLTVPAKPLTAVTVMVELAEVPATTAAGEVAVIVKSVMVKGTLVEWVIDPLVPVTITL